MKKIILIISIIFYNASIQAQELKIKIHPSQKYTWSILYQIKDFKNIYIANQQPDSTGVFRFDMKGKEPGEYVMLYDMNRQKKVYFIYNNEDINLEVYPEQNHKIEIKTSKENKIYLPFAGKRDYLISVLDDLEKQFEDHKLPYPDRVMFNNFKKNLTKLLHSYLQKSEGYYVHDLIQNSKEYYGDVSLDQNSYFNDKLEHYFDDFDFNNPVVVRSHLLSEKVYKYIFKIAPPHDPSTAEKEYMARIKKIWHKIKDERVKQDMILSLIQAFVNVNGRVSKELIEKYYNTFPPEVQSQLNIDLVQKDLGLLEGETAPDFTFSDMKTTRKLSDIKSDKILLVFWSATCPHCLKAMPEIQKLMKNRKNWKVIAIGLEGDKTDWIREHYFYPEFIHGVFSNPENKWDQEIVKKYFINATPSFFILDKNKKIIAKPYEVEDVIKTIESMDKNKTLK